MIGAQCLNGLDPYVYWVSKLRFCRYVSPIPLANSMASPINPMNRRRLPPSMSLFPASPILAAPAQAETLSCFSYYGKTAVFIRKGEGFDRPYKIFGKDKIYRFEIVQETEHIIKLLNSNPKVMSVVALIKKKNRFELFGGAGSLYKRLLEGDNCVCCCYRPSNTRGL